MADVDELFNCFNEEADEADLEPPVAITEGPVVVQEKNDVQMETEKYEEHFPLFIMIDVQINFYVCFLFKVLPKE